MSASDIIRLLNGGSVWPLVAFWLALILAVGATVCAFIFVLSKKGANAKNKFLKFLRDFCDFRHLYIETALKALYICTTAFLIIFGFFMLFSNFGQGIVLMLIAPIVLRLVYELLMLFILLVKNTIEINSKLKDQTPDEEVPDVFATPLTQRQEEPAPAPAPVEEVVAAPTVKRCPNCGSVVSEGDSFCVTCGTKL